jgi:aspartyl-tRNA(Asn)/glutamyl-tRNA(Gln) amidotransferase subunit A
MAKDRANSNHSADRREVLRTIGAASAALGFSPAFPMRATAQSKPGDLPANIAEAGKRFRDRSLGITELTKSYLKGAKELQPKLNQYITLTEEEALKTAAQLESELAQGKARGPLHGIPIVYKDNMDTAGTKTTVGSEFFKDRVPQSDAHVVALLKSAGAIMLAKTNMNEFAAGVAGRNKYFGDTHNPWDVNRWPGGSSSGTAASVAAGVCLGGLGSDTGVSIRGPAAWCGLVGIRPSYGRVSVRGVFPRAMSFDTIGPMAHTVADTAMLLQAIAEYDSQDKYAVRAPAGDFSADLNGGVKGLRLGVVEDFTYRNVDADTAKAVQASVDLFGKMGAEIKSVKIPLFTGKLDFKYPLTILFYEFNQIFGDTYRAAPDKSVFGPVVHANIAAAEKISKETYEAAIRERPKEIDEIRKVFGEVDAFLTPTEPYVAPLMSENAEADAGVRQFTVPVSFTGFPALSVPCGFSASGMPIGLQITANDFREQLLFRIAAALERELALGSRRASTYWQG